MFVTDPVEPLSSQLNQDPDKNLVLWGLYKVAVMYPETQPTYSTIPTHI